MITIITTVYSIIIGQLANYSWTESKHILPNTISDSKESQSSNPLRIRKKSNILYFATVTETNPFVTIFLKRLNPTPLRICFLNKQKKIIPLQFQIQ